MKRILLMLYALCVLFAMSSLACAEFYDCVKCDGTLLTTDGPIRVISCKNLETNTVVVKSCRIHGTDDTVINPILIDSKLSRQDKGAKVRR